MDQDYLRNIAGSLHIDEGLGDRFIARGKSGLQRIAALGGGDISDVNYTKAESIFKSFLKKISVVLKDFSDEPTSVATRLSKMRPPLNPEQQQLLKDFQTLYSSIVSLNYNPEKAGTPTSHLTEILKEEFLSRPLSLNLALQSNNATKILNAYASYLKNVYNEFIRDTLRVTNMTKDDIKKVISEINPNWGNIVSKVAAIFSPSTAGVAAAAPQLSPTHPPVPAPKPAATGVGKQTTPADDFGNIILNVMRIVVNAVKADEERAKYFFGTPKTPVAMPSTWDVQSPTKTKIDEETGDESPNKDAEKKNADDEDEPLMPHEFLYNFHSAYRKQRHFSIEVPNPTGFEYVNNKRNELNKVDVIWDNESHENNIYVKHVPIKKEVEPATGQEIETPLGESKSTLLFKFWDDQVNPRNIKGKFDIFGMLKQANENSVELLSNASHPVLNSIKAASDSFLRALYAVTYRKGMEFVRRPFVLVADEQGNVFKVKKNGDKELVPKATVLAKIHSSDDKEREQWLKSLEHIKYFEKFPAMKPGESFSFQNIAAAQTAYDALKGETLQMTHKKASELIQKAVDDLGPDASTDEYVKYALTKQSSKEAPPEPPKISHEPVKPVSGPASAPVTAPVSAPVSGGASAPVSTSEPPEPEKIPSKPKENELGTANWDEKGIVTWTKSNGAVRKFTPNQLKHMSIPKLELLLKKGGYFTKYPSALKTNLDEELINPFSGENFLY